MMNDLEVDAICRDASVIHLTSSSPGSVASDLNMTSFGGCYSLMKYSSPTFSIRQEDWQIFEAWIVENFSEWYVHETREVLRTQTGASSFTHHADSLTLTKTQTFSICVCACADARAIIIYLIYCKIIFLNSLRRCFLRSWTNLNMSTRAPTCMQAHTCKHTRTERERERER